MGFRFPNDPEIRSKWVIAMHQGDAKISANLWQPGPSHRLCSAHFVESDFISKGNRKFLKPGTISTVFPWSPSDVDELPKK